MKVQAAGYAGVAELADARDLKSRGSDPVPVRPRSPAPYRGVEQLVARRAHNPEVGGSSPPSATRKAPDFARNRVFYLSESCIFTILKFATFVARGVPWLKSTRIALFHNRIAASDDAAVSLPLPRCFHRLLRSGGQPRNF